MLYKFNKIEKEVFYFYLGVIFRFNIFKFYCYVMYIYMCGV